MRVSSSSTGFMEAAPAISSGRPSARNKLHVQLDKFLFANPSYRGICLDFEMIPDEDQKLYAEWIAELHSDFRAKNLRIYVNAQVSADDATIRHLAQASDGIILMNYDEHEVESQPGPIASQDWFVANLARVRELAPSGKKKAGLPSPLSAPPRGPPKM